MKGKSYIFKNITSIEKAFTFKMVSRFILFTSIPAFLILSSCVRNAFKNPCSWPAREINHEGGKEYCYNNHFWGFKPVVGKNNGNNTSFYWKLCKSSKSWENIDGNLFIIVQGGNAQDPLTGQPVKGLPNYIAVGAKYGEYFESSSVVSYMLSVKEIKDGKKYVYRSVKEALTKCEDYKYVYDKAVEKGCPETFDCLPGTTGSGSIGQIGTGLLGKLHNCGNGSDYVSNSSIIPCLLE